MNQPQAKIKELLDHRMEREKQVLTYLSEGRDTIESLVRPSTRSSTKTSSPRRRARSRSTSVKLVNEARVEERGEKYAVS